MSQDPGPTPPSDIAREAISRKMVEAIRRSVAAVSQTPDSQSVAETRDLEAERQKAEIEGTKQDISERKKYAHRSFCLVAAWLLVIGVIMFFQGFKLHGFSLEPEVLMALIGGTTTGIVGIFLIVSRYLFPPR